jgi:hypothetical protein
VRERNDLAAPLAQRRHRQRQAVDAVVEVAAKCTALHLDVEVFVGGRDEAHIDGVADAAADAHHPALFEHAQQLALNRARHVADLVQEDAAAARALQQPGARLHSAGE